MSVVNDNKSAKDATLICFAGAGGTGKTSVVNRLLESVKTSVVHRSIVREFYASRGVDSEAGFLSLPPEARAEFQIALYTYYIDKLEEFCTQNAGRVVLCERSIFDHFAYTLYGSRELFDNEAMKLLEDGVRRFKALRPCVFYLPYPTPWDHLAADGFRARELAKDSIVDAVIFKLLSSNRAVWTNTLPTVSVEARVTAVISSVWGDSHVSA